MTDCTIKGFDGCSCRPGECRSIHIRLEDHRQRHNAAVADYQRTLKQSFFACVATVCVGTLMAWSLVVADREIKHQDLRMQEVRGASLVYGGLRRD